MNMSLTCWLRPRTIAEHQRLKEVCKVQAELVNQLTRQKQGLLAMILTRIRKRADLAARFDLLKKPARHRPGRGGSSRDPYACLKLGLLKPGQAAALLGVAPAFDRDFRRQ